MPEETDTIAAIATPMGEGGIAVVRLSGPGALTIADRVFRAKIPIAEAPSHTLHHGFFLDLDGTVLDEGVAAVFRAPHSYTGEHVAELSCHAGPLLPRRVLSLCLRFARPAGPGEFTRRAYLHGKLDLAQAEAVADLIAARSETARRMAMAQLSGRLSDRLHKLRTEALTLLAGLEANLDFADEEVPELPNAQLRKRIQSLLDGLDGILAAGNARVWRDGLRVVLAGPPNAGKSSLFNAFLGEERAIVTPHPGTTRDTLEETVLFSDVPVVLVDTAGIRTKAGKIEAQGIERARRELSAGHMALWVADSSRLPNPLERRSAQEFRNGILALNKSDRPRSRGLATRQRAGWAWKGPVVSVSARTGDGMPELRTTILRAGGAAEPPVDAGYVNIRQERALLEARSALTRAAEAPEEAVALELRAAVAAMDSITGKDGLSEEVLDAIFAHFCIGK